MQVRFKQNLMCESDPVEYLMRLSYIGQGICNTAGKVSLEAQIFFTQQ